jgi:hypothetical protein
VESDAHPTSLDAEAGGFDPVAEEAAGLAGVDDVLDVENVPPFEAGSIATRVSPGT